MPSKSKSQQRLFGMALAVRRGELSRYDVGEEVLDIVDGDMTDKEIEDFAKRRTSDKEHNVKESELTDDEKRILAARKNGSHIPTGISTKQEDKNLSSIERYLKNRLVYSSGIHPKIEVHPDTKYVFVVVKPGFSKLSQTIIDRFEDSGFSLYKTRTKLLSEREAKQLYYVHKEEDFYEQLCKYMSSDISIGILFTYPSTWKQDRVFKKVDKIKDEIRKEYSESDMRNVMHSSDNIENMRVECSKYFNEII